MKRFELRSEFAPRGDQPEAIEKLSAGFLGGAKHQTLSGVTGSGKTFTVANIVKNIQKPTLVIAHNKTLAAQLADEFRQFFPENEVHYFVSYYDYYQPEAYIPSTDTYIEKDSAINDEIDRLRHAATHALLTRKDVLIVASVSCIYGLGSPEFYRSSNFTLQVGAAAPRREILRALIKEQFERNEVDFKRGTFRLKGDTLELFPAYAESFIKVDFFGDTVEKIAEFSWPGRELKRKHDSFEVFPAKHFITPEAVQKEALLQIREDLGQRLFELEKEGKVLEANRLQQRTNYDIEMIEETGTCAGIENYSRYFDRRRPGQPPAVLLDYFPKDYLTVIDESHITVPQIGAMYAGDRSRKEKLIDFGFRLPSAFDNRPLQFDEFSSKTNQSIYVSATPGEYELSKSGPNRIARQFIRPTGLLDPEVEVKKTAGQVADLISRIKVRAEKGQRTLVTTLTKRMAEELSEYLKESGLKVAYIHSDIETLERTQILHALRLGKFDVLIGINLLREGLDLPEVSLVAILDADKEGFLRSKTSLIQTIGRAARHSEGRAVLYADRITGSMQAAIEETNARRKIQSEYNQKNHITPTTVEKKLNVLEIKTEEALLSAARSFKKLPKGEKKKIIGELQELMEEAAARLEFERAALLRDQISSLEALL